MKIRDIIKAIEEDGWQYHSQTGSHRQFKHPLKKGRVTIAGHPSDEVRPRDRKSILKQAGIETQ